MTDPIDLWAQCESFLEPSNDLNKEYHSVATRYVSLQRWNDFVTQHKDWRTLVAYSGSGVVVPLEAITQVQDQRHVVKITFIITQISPIEISGK